MDGSHIPCILADNGMRFSLEYRRRSDPNSWIANIGGAFYCVSMWGVFYEQL
mgnify:CR=1 FL=1